MLLPILVGRARAFEIVIGADDIDAITAEKYGCVSSSHFLTRPRFKCIEILTIIGQGSIEQSPMVNSTTLSTGSPAGLGVGTVTALQPPSVTNQ
jgi:hypothetical protein